VNTTERRGYQAYEIDPVSQHTCREALSVLRGQISGFVSAGVVGPDGFEVAALSNGPLEVAKVAALSSTLVAVAEAFALESNMKSCRAIILENDDGNTLLLGVPVHGANYALFVIAEKAVTLGLVLARARMCAAKIQEILNQRLVGLSE
jgi:predicted regulator of Ras-like GTPase activity (Roadblock/LC7/MglB family)